MPTRAVTSSGTGGLPGPAAGSEGSHEGVEMINSVHLLTTAGPLTADDRGSSWPGAEVAAAFADAVESGRLNLPRHREIGRAGGARRGRRRDRRGSRQIG